MGTTPLITTNNPQNTRSTKPDQATRRGMRVGDLIYPQMKLLDMGFWQVGFDNSQDV